MVEKLACIQAIEKQHQFLLFSAESFESDFDPKLHLKF